MGGLWSFNAAAVCHGSARAAPGRAGPGRTARLYYSADCKWNGGGGGGGDAATRINDGGRADRRTDRSTSTASPTGITAAWRWRGQPRNQVPVCPSGPADKSQYVATPLPPGAVIPRSRHVCPTGDVVLRFWPTRYRRTRQFYSRRYLFSPQPFRRRVFNSRNNSKPGGHSLD